MAVSAAAECDAIRESLQALTEAAEHSDAEIGRRLRLAEVDRGDAGAEQSLCEAYAQKCDHMRASATAAVKGIRDGVATVSDATMADVERAAVLDEENTGLRRENRELKRELEEAKEAAATATASHRAAAAESVAATTRAKMARRGVATIADTGPFDYRPEMGAAFADFVERRRKLNAVLEKARSRFSYFSNDAAADGSVLGFSVKSLSDEAVAALEQEAADWIAQRGVAAELEGLQQSASALSAMGWPAEHCDVEVEQALAERVDALAVGWRKRLAGLQVKLEQEKAKIAKFLKQDAKLLHWCRQERTNLEALAEPHYVQDFCASLIQNISVMDGTFVGLLDEGQQLLPNRDVEKALVEVNEVWLNLQLYAYERQRHIMLEIHARSRLEDEVRAFSSFSQRLDKWLGGSPNSIKETLELPTDDESRRVVREPLEECKQLKRGMEQFQGLSDHLHDFSIRMESIRDNYMTLRRSVLGRLTFLASDRRAVSDAAEQRKREFGEKVDDLKVWCDRHTGGEKWATLLQRLQTIGGKLDALGEQRDEPADVSASNIKSQAHMVPDDEGEQF